MADSQSTPGTLAAADSTIRVAKKKEIGILLILRLRSLRSRNLHRNRNHRLLLQKS